MITLSKSGNTVTFTFDENSGYLQNGTIDVPVNSLSLILDESDMATFRKSASNDIFVSANIAEFDMSKSELEAWYKANMVGSSGGGGTGGTTPEEVQQMIDESISGKADSSSLATVATSGSYSDLINKPIVSTAITSGDTNAVAGGAVYDQLTIGGGSGMVEITAVTASAWVAVSMPDCDKLTISASTAIGNEITSGGKYLQVYDKSTETLVLSFNYVSDINSDYVTVEGSTADTSISLVAVDGYYFKGNDTMYFKSNYSGGWVVTFYRLAEVMSWLKDVVSANTAAIEGKQDTLSAGTGIEISGNVISATGGGATYTAGNGINIDTANTISLGVAISAGTGSYSIIEGYRTSATSEFSHAEGKQTKAAGKNSHAEGSFTNAVKNDSHAEGNNTYASGQCSHAEGVSTTASGNYSHAEGNHTGAIGDCSHAEGYGTTASGNYSHAEGTQTNTKNEAEHASGRYNWSKKATNDFGHSGNTLFSVGNGTYYGGEGVLHNAIDIRQNGDIYIVDTSSSGEYFDKQMIKLQDSLGGTVSSAITSGDTNAVAGGAVYDKFDEVESVTAAALNNLNDKFGGLRLEKLTQAQYDALSGNTDSNTLYVIVN